MSQTETKVTLYSCDADGCTKTAIAEDGGRPASGIRGTVEISEELGGGSAEWFSHAPVHYGKAVKTILAKTGRRPEGEEDGAFEVDTADQA